MAEMQHKPEVLQALGQSEIDSFLLGIRILFVIVALLFFIIGYLFRHYRLYKNTVYQAAYELKQVKEHTAKLMVALVIVQIPAVFIMEAFNITSLMVFKGEILNTFELSQRQDLAMLLLKINDYGALTLEMFWGLWLIPFGLLVHKSGFIPRIFGILLIIAGIAYMNDSFIALLLPGIHDFINQPTLLFVAIGEISITGWLLIKGVKNE